MADLESVLSFLIPSAFQKSRLVFVVPCGFFWQFFHTGESPALHHEGVAREWRIYTAVGAGP